MFICHTVSFLLDSKVYLEKPNAIAKEKSNLNQAIRQGGDIRVFNIFPRHYLKCFPFPNQQHCSVLIGLAIRCNWPPITFPPKLIFISVPNKRKDNTVCQAETLTHRASQKEHIEDTRASMHWVSNLQVWGVYANPFCGQADWPGQCLGKWRQQPKHTITGTTLLPGDSWSQSTSTYSNENIF